MGGYPFIAYSTRNTLNNTKIKSAAKNIAEINFKNSVCGLPVKQLYTRLLEKKFFAINESMNNTSAFPRLVSSVEGGTNYAQNVSEDNATLGKNN